MPANQEGNPEISANSASADAMEYAHSPSLEPESTDSPRYREFKNNVHYSYLSEALGLKSSATPVEGDEPYADIEVPKAKESSKIDTGDKLPHQRGKEKFKEGRPRHWEEVRGEKRQNLH